MNDAGHHLSLICSVQRRLYAVPVEHVVETMRVLPIEPIADAPPAVLGLAVIRGEPLPVVDAAMLLAGQPSALAASQRFVVINTGSRRLALLVDAVPGVHRLAAATGATLPPLLDQRGDTPIAAIGRLDGELLMVLNAARLLPESFVGQLSEASS